MKSVNVWLNWSIPWKGKELDGFFKDVPIKLLGDLRPLWQKVYPAIAREILANFAAEGRPDKWQELNPEYKEWKRKRGFSVRRLVMTGRMWKAATTRGHAENICLLEKQRMEWGIDASNFPGKYPIVHDKGSRGVRPIPQRTFMMLTKAGVANVVQQAWMYIRNFIKSESK